MTHPKAKDLARYLRQYLKENYPEKVTDTSFISSRGNLSQKEFEQTYMRTKDYSLSYEQAIGVLLRGYLFSRREFLSDILTEAYGDVFSSRQLRKMRSTFERDLAHIFKKYPLSNELLIGDNILGLKYEIMEAIADKVKMKHVKKS